MSAGRDKNQDRIAIARFLHSQLQKFSLRPGQSVLLKFPSLDKNADLTGTFPLRFSDRLDDAGVIEPAKKMMRAHLVTNCRSLRRLRWTRHRHRIH
jgi:hypothetical protein